MQSKLSFSSILRWLYLFLILVLFIEIIKPDQASKERLPNEDYTSFGSDPLNFELFERGYWIVKLDSENSVNNTFQFNTEQRVRLVFGILPWSEVQDKALRYELRKNGNTLTTIEVIGGEQSDFSFDVSDNDILEIRVINVSEVNNLQGSISIEKLYPEILFQSYVQIFMVLVIIGLVVFVIPIQQSILPLLFYFTILLTELTTMSVFSSGSLWFAFSCLMTYSALLVLIHFVSNKLIRIPLLLVIHFLAVLVLMLPLVFYAYHEVFGVGIGRAQLMAIFQSNLSEGLEYLQMYATPEVRWIGTLIWLLPLFCSWSEKPIKNLANNKRIGIPILVSLIGIITIGNTWSKTNTLNELSDSYKEYNEELTRFKSELEKFNSSTVEYKSAKKEIGETYIVVLGESLNRNHMSLYGYCRNTSPYLKNRKENNEITVYTNALSHHTHTVPVLEKALTTANQFNNQKAWESVQLIPLLKNAGFETVWISNQVKLGAWDNVVSAIASSCDQTYFLNKKMGRLVETSDYDEVVLEKLDQVLQQKNEKNRIVFVHMIGNHGNYKDRFPKTFKKYIAAKEGYAKGEFGKLRLNDMDDYDNSILYHDSVLNQVLVKTESILNQPVALIYMADHSENVMEWKGHNSGKYDYTMSEIPFFVYTNEAFNARYPSKKEQIISRRNETFTNDLFDQFILDIANVETPNFTPEYSVLNQSYSPRPKDFFMVDKQYSYVRKENKSYHEKKNVSILNSKEEGSRLIPHRVNSKCMFYEIVQRGFKGFEIDLYYVNDSLQGSKFLVGHDLNDLSENSMEDVLQWEGCSKMKKIWLDIKNADQGNMRAIQARLNYLDKQWGIKDRVIVETTSRSALFQNVSSEGFHTSYYLPTSIKNIKSDTKLKSEANRIIEQLKDQKLKAISFDSELLPFVLDYIQPKIPNEIVYHTWDISQNWENPDLIESLQSMNYYKNQRVKTILIRYNSKYYF